MKRLLFFSLPISIVACSILPIVDSVSRHDDVAIRFVDVKEESTPLIAPAQKLVQAERQRPKKIVAYSSPCSNIKTESLKAEILAKLDCIDAELSK